MKRSLQIALLLAVFLLCNNVVCFAQPKIAQRKFIASSGAGYLEKVGTQLVLHLKGTPEEMGTQHGTLLRQHIKQNIETVEKAGMTYFGGSNVAGKLAIYSVWQKQLQHMPPRYVKEMQALAKAAGVEFERVRDTNTIPEFFHCSGFAVFSSATFNGELLHGRILDYGTDLGLQDHSVVIIAQPRNQIPFVNVTYAGFIGSVTGMNLRGMGFGEMGGGGEGKWDGTPMSFLMRRGLEECDSLNSARELFQASKRTCEYYYVISDAKVPDAVGVAATPESIEFVRPNEAKGTLTEAVKDAVLLSAGERYALLVERVRANHGKITPQICLDIMKRPVAMKSCLHTALMAPMSRQLWVAHATSKGEPASDQPYTYLDIKELMSRKP